MAAAGQTREHPMQPGGNQLVAWAFGEDERDRWTLTQASAGTGAVIAGRRTYDSSLPWGERQHAARQAPLRTPPRKLVTRRHRRSALGAW